MRVFCPEVFFLEGWEQKGGGFWGAGGYIEFVVCNDHFKLHVLKVPSLSGKCVFAPLADSNFACTLFWKTAFEV